MTDLAEHYAEQRRRNDVAKAEWEAWPHGWRFAVHPRAEEWAHELAAYRVHDDLPVLPETTRDWLDALGAVQVRDSYLGTLLDELLAAAVRDGAFVPPAPGVVAIAFANRDGRTEEECALGWGYRPAAAEELVVQGTSADIELLAGGATGWRAVLGVLRVAESCLAAVRFASVQTRRKPGTTVLPRTSWSPPST